MIKKCIKKQITMNDSSKRLASRGNLLLLWDNPAYNRKQQGTQLLAYKQEEATGAQWQQGTEQATNHGDH